MHNQNIIEPKNLPMWTAAGVIISLLAVTIAVFDMYRSSAAAVISQAHVLLLNQKIEALTLQVQKPTPAVVKPAKP